MSDLRSLSTKIAQLSARQWGHVTRTQLLDLGVGAETISYWLKTGRLIRVHVGVYAVGYRRVEPIARAAAAVLAGGDGAVLSHDSAAALWGLRRWPAQPEITAARCVRRPGIRAHRSRTLTRADVTVQRGIRVTTAARTITDIRPRLTARQLTRAVNDARHARILSADAAAALLHHRHGPTRSEFEDAFMAFVARYHLPRPEINTRVHGYEVDALFPAQRLIVELDGWEYHSGHAAFTADRERDAALLAAGYSTVRVTWDRLRDHPRREAARLKRILRARAA